MGWRPPTGQMEPCQVSGTLDESSLRVNFRKLQLASDVPAGAPRKGNGDIDGSVCNSKREGALLSEEWLTGVP